MPLNHLGAFQLKSCGDVTVEVSELAANKLRKSQPSTQAFSTRPFDSTWCEMLWRNRMRPLENMFSWYAVRDITRQVEWVRRECMGTRLRKSNKKRRMVNWGPGYSAELPHKIFFQGDSFLFDWLRNWQRMYCVAFFKWDTHTPKIYVVVICTAVFTHYLKAVLWILDSLFWCQSYWILE